MLEMNSIIIKIFSFSISLIKSVDQRKMHSSILCIVLIGVVCCAFALPSPVTNKAPRFQFDVLESEASIRERRSPAFGTEKPRLQFDGDFSGLEEAVQLRERRSPGTEKPPRRQKRATCGLLSGFGVNDSACAVHCVAIGYRGGWCDSQRVCNCR